MARKIDVILPDLDFPSAAEPDSVKESWEYGKQVGGAILYEWYRKDNNSCRYFDRRREFQRRRLYALGKQPIQKYKDELAYDGDLSHLNLDWSVIPILPKFVDIVVNGMQDRLWKVRAEAQDAKSSDKRTRYQEEIESQMVSRDILEDISMNFGVDPFTTDPGNLPETDEELELHMQLEYKPAIEIATEVGVTTLMEQNNYNEVKRRRDYDIVTIGVGVEKHEFLPGAGVKISYTDPEYWVHSYTEDPYFSDCFYFGEVKQVPLTELHKIKPDISRSEIEDISKRSMSWYSEYNYNFHYKDQLFYKDTATLLYFNYKTTTKTVYKKRINEDGTVKMIEKDESFNPPQEEMEKGRFEVVEKTIDVWYEGIMVAGTDIMLKWEKQKNMVRPKSASQHAMPQYVACAPKIYKDYIESLLDRMIPFGDSIQLNHLKLQQVRNRMVPDGVFLDADGINEVSLGEGMRYSPRDALRLFFQTGSVIGRSMTQEGEFNHARVPIQELTSNSGLNKMQSLIMAINHDLEMLRGVTGLNEARDGSDPDPRALVGVQKLAALNSNTATRHILDGSLFMCKTMAICLYLRMSDILEYADFAEQFARQIGKYNVAIIDEIRDLYLYDLGIFIEMMPDAEEKEKLELDIRLALDRDGLLIEDAIDIRQIGNIKLANQMLKVKRKRREKQRMTEERMKQDQIGQQNQALSAQKAQEQMQIMQMKSEGEANVYRVKGEEERKSLDHEAGLKAKLMVLESRLKRQEIMDEGQSKMGMETFKEDRKDKRTQIQATQQSKMISQRNNDTGPIDFESVNADLSGMDMSEIGVGL